MADLAGVPLELCQPLREGKLYQTCPACGEWSAATWHCFACFAVTGPPTWHAHKSGEGPSERRGAPEGSEADKDATSE